MTCDFKTKTESWGQGWYWSEFDDSPCYGPFPTKEDAKMDWADDEDAVGHVEFAQMEHPSICCDVFDAETVLEDVEERNEEAHWYEAPPVFSSEDQRQLELMLADTLRRWLETNDRKKEFRGLVGWKET